MCDPGCHGPKTSTQSSPSMSVASEEERRTDFLTVPPLPPLPPPALLAPTSSHQLC
jgi:hypothetical protein